MAEVLTLATAARRSGQRDKRQSSTRRQPPQTPQQRDLLAKGWRLVDALNPRGRALWKATLRPQDSGAERPYLVEVLPDLTLRLSDPDTGEEIARSSLHRRRRTSAEGMR